LIKKDPVLWRKAIEKAVSFYDYIIDSAIEKHDPGSAEGSKKIAAEVARFIEPIDNLVVKNHYLKKLSEKLSVPQNVLETQLAREFKKILVPRVQDKNTQDVVLKSRSELLEEYLLSLLLQVKKPTDYLLLINSRLRPEDFINPALAKIYQTLPCSFDKFPPELLATVDRLFLQENGLDLQDDTRILQEIQKTVWEIKELTLREKLKKISGALKQKSDDPNLQVEFDQTTSSLQKLSEDKKLIDP